MSNLTISTILEAAFRAAFTELGLAKEVPVLLVEATRPEFGDFQMNGAMGAAKALKTNPRELAAKIIASIKLNDIVAKLEIAGPGFINITLHDKYLANFIAGLNSNNQYGVQYIGHQPENVVVDLSSPNLAKEMHVGHLRSTVIGDALARIFEFMGDTVIRQNHVGDWGTQFGMLIAYMEEHNFLNDANELDKYKNTTRVGHSFSVRDLEQFYRNAKQKFDEDPDFANLAREYVVKLQNWREGNEDVYNDWSIFRDESLRHCQEIYDLLGIPLTKSDAIGESFYETNLPDIIRSLEQKHLISESNGAKCVFFAAGELSGGEETPFIVQKQDGGYLYATTDLAAINYRVNTLQSHRIVYVVDARQSFHFKQLFLVAKKAGFVNHGTKLEHTPFGTMMNEEGKPFKTRDGGTVRLIDLIREAKLRAKNIIHQRNPDWTDDEKSTLADILAIDSIKYSDLSKNRNSDYIFSFDKMLAFDGNTAPYLLYAYTRIQSILNKAEVRVTDTKSYQININELAEHKLALHIAKFADTVDITSREAYPHYLCQYLYNLAGFFMQFYEACPILKSEDVSVKQSRLALASLTSEILHTGLCLLGIKTVNRM
jgi:arginyl-tRNA synthetase